MAANHTTTLEVADSEVVAALEVIRRHARLKNTVQVFIEAGVTSATGYRRLKKPGDIQLDELVAISDKFHVPLHVIAEGELATARWFKERPSDPGPSGGQEVSHRACNVVTLRGRKTRHSVKAA